MEAAEPILRSPSCHYGWRPIGTVFQFGVGAETGPNRGPDRQEERSGGERCEIGQRAAGTTGPLITGDRQGRKACDGGAKREGRAESQGVPGAEVVGPSEPAQPRGSGKGGRCSGWEYAQPS